jgi:hypothetical protein
MGAAKKNPGSAIEIMCIVARRRAQDGKAIARFLFDNWYREIEATPEEFQELREGSEQARKKRVGHRRVGCPSGSGPLVVLYTTSMITSSDWCAALAVLWCLHLLNLPKFSGLEKRIRKDLKSAQPKLKSIFLNEIKPLIIPEHYGISLLKPVVWLSIETRNEMHTEHSPALTEWLLQRRPVVVELYLCVTGEHCVVAQVSPSVPALLFDPIRSGPIAFTCENMIKDNLQNFSHGFKVVASDKKSPS